MLSRDATIQFPTATPVRTLLVGADNATSSIDGLLVRIPGRVCISYEPSNDTNLVTVHLYGSVYTAKSSRPLDVDTLLLRKGLTVLTLNAATTWAPSLTSLVHVVLHQPHRLRYLSTTADTVLLPPIHGSVLPSDDVGRRSHVQLTARATGSIYVNEAPPLEIGSLTLENYGSGAVQVQLRSRLAVQTTLEVKAMGTGAIAIATPHLDANLVRTFAASDGDVYLEAGTLSAPFLRSTMAGSGDIAFASRQHAVTCANHDVSMLGDGTIDAGAMACNRTFVYSAGPGHVIVDGGLVLETTHVGSGHTSYASTPPLSITHIGFGPRQGVHASQAVPRHWTFAPAPPMAPLAVMALEATTMSHALASSVEGVLFVCVAAAVPMLLWTYLKRRNYALLP
ncbi:hypothetical protein SPRG_07787 [Saprolegnia parasitica CBS 223.65]|uniref:Uncharacterized protein n=1 Tax=Saprolegnia parasitica (strain CBS 223.65) TaxID=695850 RepID=A0A067CJU4_SAPPC|nr:hypothetical protein SPRG_07787 [Saprolegnia parasitica CBS 223.65]KDO27077.1 hypothetical protein SPRG_07787 [Saprolegnia parasitica CBS 223.65]|eukprot:XP_012202171.1 hypothetical protein SPRG_07787 [Saprolegnia parasitica CBS 223.65]